MTVILPWFNCVVNIILVKILAMVLTPCESLIEGN